MAALHMDHFITFADVKNVDAHAETYAARGFLVTDETRRYQPGLRNRFVTLGLEHLELAWVENKAVFKAGGDEEFARMFLNLPALRAAARPFGIGFVSADVVALHREWIARGYDIPDVWSFVPPNHPPVFTFQEIPPTLLPGVSSFALMYHGASENPVRQVKIAPNGVYAVEGVTFVSATPEADAMQWRDVLAREAALDYHDGVYSVVIGAHLAQWMTPDVYTQRYRVDWTDAPHSSGKLGALHLLVTNLDTAAQYLGDIVEQIGDGVVIPPNPHDGFTFTLREHPIERWCAERTARTGENITVQG